MFGGEEDLRIRGGRLVWKMFWGEEGYEKKMKWVRGVRKKKIEDGEKIGGKWMEEVRVSVYRRRGGMRS